LTTPRVAIDARKLRDGGIGTYIRELVAALAAGPDPPEMAALLDPADLGRTGWPPRAAREIGVRAGKYGVWEHVAVPQAARAAGATLLHAPHYTLPLGWLGPAVVTIHDLIHVRHREFFPPGTDLYARAVAGAAARRSRIVLADSVATRDDVITFLRAEPARVRVVPLGVAASLARPEAARIESFRRARSLPAGYLLYVGARKRHKNLGLVLEALARMAPAERPPFVLSGSPWVARERLAEQARRLGLAGGIAFAGDLADASELAALYAGAALYVQPSLFEGFGLPPLEAMACGTPVLSSDGGALPEAVGDAALVLPPREPERWAEAIHALLGDEARRADLARRGLARARTFTWEKTATATLAAYRDALG